MERKPPSEIRDHAQRAAEAAKDVAKSAGKVGVEVAKVIGRAGFEVASRGGKKAARYVKAHPKETALGLALAMTIPQKGHEQKEDGERFVEQTIESRVLGDEWMVDVHKVAPIVIDESYGTLYALFRAIIKEDSVFHEASDDQRARIIDAMIAASRALNPDDDLDNFDSIKGKALLVPTEFMWRPREAEVLKDEGYVTLQDYAENDGFPLRTKSHQVVYESARPHTEDARLHGTGFSVKYDGSEDMEARLVPDVMESIEHFGESFSTLELGSESDGWRVVVTDMLRDEAMQRRRGSLKRGGTHSTGRSFDVSDGRWITPEGAEITWSLMDEHGRGRGRGPHADIIDQVLRPAFETLALEEGWLLYKEPGHWHIYVPEGTWLDLSDEWEGYVDSRASASKKEGGASVERGKLSLSIQESLLSEYAESVGRRVSFERLEIERDEVRRALHGGTFIHELKTHGPHSERIVDQIRRARPEDLGRLEYFRPTTIHNRARTMSDIEGVWRWKTSEKLDSPVLGEYVQERVAKENHAYDFEQWYHDAAVLHGELQEHSESLFSRAGGLTEDQARALVGAVVPEVMLSTIHAELISELPADVFVDVVPRLFDGYNIMQGPALNDRQFSSGPAQLIYPTFELMLGQYGSRLHTLQNNAEVFSSVVVPQKKDGLLPTKDVAEAMVLDRESAAFWSYMSLIYHSEAAFQTFMQNQAFEKAWEKAGEADRLRFMATFVPVANHMGRGGAINKANELLSKHGGKSLHDLAYAVQELRMKPSGVRSARVGLASMEEMIARAK